MLTGVSETGSVEIVGVEKEEWGNKKIVTTNAYEALMKMKNGGVVNEN